MADAKHPNNPGEIHHVDWDSLPQPQDDSAADHLIGMSLPSLHLNATNGERVDLSRQTGLTVLFAYPMTANPGIALPDGWDMIPGARGCTPQACAFRDLEAELRLAGADHIFGISTQSTPYQREAAERLHLPYPMLSDEECTLQKALNLPTMEVERKTLLKRLTLVVRDGTIENVWYPVFPPDQNPKLVLAWLNTQ